MIENSIGKPGPVEKKFGPEVNDASTSNLPAGRDSYANLVKQGIELSKYTARPSAEEMMQEAEAIAQKEMRYGGKIFRGSDSGSFSDNLQKNTAMAVRERFETVVKMNDASSLQGTLWEVWTVEDCKAMLAMVDDAKKVVAQKEAERLKARETKIEEYKKIRMQEIEEEDLSAPDYEGRVAELKKIVNDLEDGESAHQLEDVIGLLQEMRFFIGQNLPNPLQRSPDFVQKFNGWTDDEIDNFDEELKNALSNLDDLLNSLFSAEEEY